MKKKIEHIIVGLLIILIIIELLILYIGISILEKQIPLARFGQGAVYDSQIKKTIIFGGHTDSPRLDSQILNDMWRYDSPSNLWMEIKPNKRPSARTGHAMVYDSFNRKSILFGGLNENLGLENDTWVYNSRTNHWTEVIPDSISPDRRQGHAMCYEPKFRLVILFGGYTGNGSYFNDTWVYNYNINRWFNINTSSSPYGRYGAKIIYDQLNQRVILFGGRGASILNDLWAYYHGNNTWTRLNVTNSPDSRYGHGMVYDSYNHKAILYGGNHLGNVEGILEDTWTFNPSNNKWTEILTQEQPYRTMDFSMVYDSFNRKIILFGGWDSYKSVRGSTWTYVYNSSTWIAVKPQSRWG